MRGEARGHLEESTRLRRGTGELPGVAANLVGLAYIASDQHRPADAHTALDEARTLAVGHDATAIARQVDQARCGIGPPSTP